MKIQEKNCAKTLLSCYGHLETICGAIDKTVLSYAIKSSAMNSDVEYIANKMISLTERKKFLINVKIMIDDALNCLKNDEAKVLVLKYIDNVQTNLASEVMNISMRTFFRKINSALQNFWIALTNNGFSIKKFYEMFENEKWVLEIFESHCKRDIEEKNFQNIDIVGLAIKSYISKKIDSSKRKFANFFG